MTSSTLVDNIYKAISRGYFHPPILELPFVVNQKNFLVQFPWIWKKNEGENWADVVPGVQELVSKPQWFQAH